MKVAGNLVTLAEAVLVKLASTVKLVSEAIAITVLVSLLIVILSPITNSVVNKVLVPGNTWLAAGSAVPVRVEEAVSVIRLEPATSNLRRGAAVPIPTLPLFKIVIRSVNTLGAALVPVQKESCPGTRESAMVPEDIALMAAPVM